MAMAEGAIWKREREGQKIQSEREKDGDRDRSAEDYTIFRGIIGTK